MWPPQIKEIHYISLADNAPQPAMFYAPKSDKPVPLLVALHSWSSDYKQKNIHYATWCIEKNWVMIHPNFRGPNCNPDATGSDKVIKDILSAVDYAKANANIDTQRIYLVGGSGGGYAALLMAGRAPGIWTGVSAWVPITDLRQWYRECKKAERGYAEAIVNSCGGVPGESCVVDLEYKNRSPITHLKNAKKLPLDINAGITDGHTGSVPISHSLNAFNVVAAERDRISKEDIQYFVEKAHVPPHLKKPIADPLYGKNPPLFRRQSGNARITIFKGGHQMVPKAALTWLSEQKK
jgi:acetyl esterase/lipase